MASPLYRQEVGAACATPLLFGKGGCVPPQPTLCTPPQGRSLARAALCLWRRDRDHAGRDDLISVALPTITTLGRRLPGGGGPDLQ